MDENKIFVLIMLSIIMIIGIFSIILTSNFLNFIKKIIVKTRKNELIFYREYMVASGYSIKSKFGKINIKKAIKIFKKNKNDSNNIGILSKFNGFYYPFHDLDNINDLKLFKKLYSANPYVIFKSSSDDRYWGIVDFQNKKIKNILLEHNWGICNDSEYVKYSEHYKLIIIRGLYKNFDRKPVLFKINNKPSKNFQLFIDKLVSYYNKEGLELSVLKYQNPEMLIKFNRKRKLKNIINNNK